MRLIILSSFIFIGLFSATCEKKKEQTIHYVNDNALILTDEQEYKLTEQVKGLEQTIGSQIVILTIESLHGEKIEEYSLRMAENWRIGRKDYDDGILITVALHERQMRIEVGYGLEKIIKDEIAARIIREDVVPNFRTENYYEGISIAVGKIITLIEGNEDRVGQRFYTEPSNSN